GPGGVSGGGGAGRRARGPPGRARSGGGGGHGGRGGRWPYLDGTPGPTRECGNPNRPTGPNCSELLAVVAADDPARLRLVGGILGDEAGVGLLAGLVPGVEVLPHVVEAALLLRAGPHPAAGGLHGREAG